jgi:hypothetical protein
MRTFREMALALSQDSITEKEFNPIESLFLLHEGVIYPIKIKIPADYSIEELNKRFKDFIHFSNTKGTFYKNGKIYIKISGKESIKEIEGMISHEMIHAVQDERSKGKFLKFRDALNGILEKYLEMTDSELLKHKDEILKITHRIKKDNPYEKMAYAYQMVSTFKGRKSLKEMIDLSKNLFNLNDKEYLKYLGIYYMNIKD